MNARSVRRFDGLTVRGFRFEVFGNGFAEEMRRAQGSELRAQSKFFLNLTLRSTPWALSFLCKRFPKVCNLFTKNNQFEVHSCLF